MEQSKKTNIPWPAVFILGMIIGALFFIIIYGVGVLNPATDGWILNKGGDFTLHYICWEFFRKSSWHFPFGLFDGIIDGETVTCMFTDSIPLFAIIFKLLSPLLPDTFQYMGFWGIFSFAMQGGISALIIYKFTNKPIYSLIGCSLFVICPPVLQRMYGHESLAGQWILLLAILSWVCQDIKWRHKVTPVIIWSINGIIAVLVHIYFIPMIYLVMLGYAATDVFGRKKILRPILCFVSTTVCSLLTMYLIGAFEGSVSYMSDGLGYYSANYNTLLNSQGYSKYLPPFNCFQGQYEGFAYLGLGIIIGVIITVVLLVFQSENKNPFKLFIKLEKTEKVKIISAFVIFVISLIIAASPKGTINGHIIYDINLPLPIFKLMSIFRATGRFAWVSEYLVFISVLCIIPKFSGKRTAVFCLILITLIQLLDLRVMVKNENLRENVKTEYDTPLKDPKWREIAKQSDEILFAPLREDFYIHHELFYVFGEYAEENSLELSCFTLSRGNDYEDLRDNADAKLKQILDGTSEKKYIVVFINEEDVPAENDNITLYNLDGYNIAVNN